jgi:hypothetical protein
MLSVSLPTTPSSALKAARSYRDLLNCSLSPALHSYAVVCPRAGGGGGHGGVDPGTP